MKDIKKIGFCFENCEYFELEAKYFDHVVIDDIVESINRIALNSISQTKIANTVAFEIFKDISDIKYYPFGIEDEDAKTNYLSRIKDGQDITQICFIFNDDSAESYFVDWSDESEWCNPYQKTFVNEYGNLYIVISKTKDIKDFWDEEEIADTEYLELRRNLILN